MPTSPFGYLAHFQPGAGPRRNRVYHRRELLFEVRLRELWQKYRKAMDGEIKAGERLATLLGMNAPLGHAVQVISSNRAGEATELD